MSERSHVLRVDDSNTVYCLPKSGLILRVESGLLLERRKKPKVGKLGSFSGSSH